MKRRKFIANSALAASMMALPIKTLAETGFTGGMVKKIKPPRLKEGDTVGLIAPGSFIDEEELKDSVENLEALGLRVFYTDNILARYGYLAGTDKQRSDDLNSMFANPDVKGIVCARGGYGCNRILNMIDYDLIRENPKILTGYSDITALLYALYAKSGLVSFHGPVGISTFNEYSVNYLNQVLFEAREEVVFNSNPEDAEKENNAYHPYVINEGIAEGELIGGNLSIAVTLLGTPFDVDYTGKIVFLEDVGEEPYRIDRMLTELLLADKLQKSAGIVLGVFLECEKKEEDPSFSKSFSLREVMEDRLKNLNIPIIYGLSFGHITNKFTLPFGINAKMDTGNRTITLLENAVI